MDKLTEILEAHTRFEDYACTCGWAIKDDNTFDYDSLTAHLAEMLKPLLAEVYAGAFSDGYDLAADDIGAWQCNLDHCADSGDNVDGYNNPYKKETN